jgi:phosphoglycolate phosphatase
MTESLPSLIPSLIFDLDGTLTDSKPGILGCLREVLHARGIGDTGPLDRFIGPPVEQWVAELLPDGSLEDHAALAREYRACYDRTGWRNNAVYPGAAQMLTKLRNAGFPLYVCTSKQEHFALRILQAFDLARVFTAIYGDKLEYPSHSKTDLLTRVLKERELATEQTWMIGDRSFDIEAAHANGIRCVAAAWGYGAPEEWAQADAIAHAPAEVMGIVSAQPAVPAADNVN